MYLVLYVYPVLSGQAVRVLLECMNRLFETDFA